MTGPRRRCRYLWRTPWGDHECVRAVDHDQAHRCDCGASKPRRPR